MRVYQRISAWLTAEVGMWVQEENSNLNLLHWIPRWVQRGDCDARGGRSGFKVSFFVRGVLKMIGHIISSIQQ